MSFPRSFYRFKFRVSSSQITVTLSLMMSTGNPNSPNLNPLYYQFWGQCWSLITSCNSSQKQFPILKMHFS